MKVKDFITEYPGADINLLKKIQHKGILNEPVNYGGNDIWLAQELNVNLNDIEKFVEQNTKRIPA